MTIIISLYLVMGTAPLQRYSEHKVSQCFSGRSSHAIKARIGLFLTYLQACKPDQGSSWPFNRGRNKEYLIKVVDVVEKVIEMLGEMLKLIPDRGE